MCCTPYRNFNILQNPLVSMAGCAMWFNLNGTMYEKLRNRQKEEGMDHISPDLFAKSIVLRYLNPEEGKAGNDEQE